MNLIRPLALFSTLLLCSSTALAGDIPAPRTFKEAKKIAWKLYAGHEKTFYCGCEYKGNRVDLESCGYQPRKNANRAARVEWEHIVPAWVIGHQRQCWQNGGRKSCTTNDSVFTPAEADLVPSIGEVNGDRGNFAYGMLPQKPTQYGTCPMVVNFAQKTAMPPESVRGAAARETWPTATSCASPARTAAPTRPGVTNILSATGNSGATRRRAASWAGAIPTSARSI